MVLPLIPIALAGIGGGIAGGFLTSIFGGGGKKDVAASEIHAPYEEFAPVKVYAPSISRVYAPSQMFQIDSPGAEMTKKDVITAESRADPTTTPITYRPSTAPSAGITEGTDLTKIAMIGGAALIGYGIVTEVL